MKKQIIKADGSSRSFGGSFLPTTVLIDNIVQPPTYYSLSGMNSITFNSAPPKGSSVTLIATVDEDPIQKLGLEKSNEILKQYLLDIKLIEQNPTVKKAWQHFQSTKKLIK